MVLWATLLVIHGATIAGSLPVGGTPENITVVFLSSSEVKVSWTTAIETIEKYDVTYKPTDASYRVVVVVAGNSNSVTLSGLKPSTQYQVTVTAVRSGKKYRSRPVVFRTLDAPKTPTETTVRINGVPPNKMTKGPIPPPHPGHNPPYIQTMTQVRGIEVGIVCLVLLAWVGAIALFFNRWGKIRMLLPYQPDYKDTQLKVPGTCQGATVACQGGGSSGFCCSQSSSCCFVFSSPPRSQHHPRDCNCSDNWQECQRIGSEAQDDFSFQDLEPTLPSSSSQDETPRPSLSSQANSPVTNRKVPITCTSSISSVSQGTINDLS